tara:strand:+ start:128 stop:517 length:390 start_codon:yes stop_codon:yes gene_type:complete
MIEMLMKMMAAKGSSAKNLAESMGENVGGNIIDSFGGAKDNLTDFASDPMGSLMDMRSIGHLKALTQSPEAYQKWLMENPAEAVAKPPMGIPEIPQSQMPYALPQQGFMNQQPNYLNSSQQVLSGGPYG